MDLIHYCGDSISVLRLPHIQDFVSVPPHLTSIARSGMSINQSGWFRLSQENVIWPLKINVLTHQRDCLRDRYVDN